MVTRRRLSFRQIRRINNLGALNFRSLDVAELDQGIDRAIDDSRHHDQSTAEGFEFPYVVVVGLSCVLRRQLGVRSQYLDRRFPIVLIIKPIDTLRERRQIAARLVAMRLEPRWGGKDD